MVVRELLADYVRTESGGRFTRPEFAQRQGALWPLARPLSAWATEGLALACLLELVLFFPLYLKAHAES